MARWVEPMGLLHGRAAFAAVAEDVTQVMVDGKVVVRQGDRAEIGRELDAAIDAIWKGMP